MHWSESQKIASVASKSKRPAETAAAAPKEVAAGPPPSRALGRPAKAKVSTAEVASSGEDSKSWDSTGLATNSIFFFFVKTH